MEEYCKEKINYSLVDNVDPSKYGFTRVGDKLIFSAYFIKTVGEEWRKLITSNFRDIADSYYKAMEFDAKLDSSRKRKLLTFLKSIWDQEDVCVALIMIKAIAYLKSKIEDEHDIIETIIKQILPNAGYYKFQKSGRYVWKFNEEKKFDIGIGKVFVISYINSNFDKNDTWRYIKKNCYFKDNRWRYKSKVAKDRMEMVLSNYIKDGGIVVKKVNMEFETFIPLSTVSKDSTGHKLYMGENGVISKEAGDGKKMYVYGVASNTSPDFDDERVSSNFIKKMKEQAVGLPLKVVSHYEQGDLDQTVGVITEKGGDDNTLEIEGKLQPFDHNENVKKLAQKMDDGIAYGFSIYGRVTKVFKEFDENLRKEIYVLDDGELSHILITDQPANRGTFAEGIVKSINKGKGDKFEEGREATSIENDYKHTSNLLKNEPEEDTVSKSTLPDQAFPINYKTSKVYKDYAHHYVSDGKLYLHKGAVLTAFKKAKADGASADIINHLANHLHIIGIYQKVDSLNTAAKAFENLDLVASKYEKLKHVMKNLSASVSVIKNLDSKLENKLVIARKMIEQVAPQITDAINDLIEEANNGNEEEN